MGISRSKKPQSERQPFCRTDLSQKTTAVVSMTQGWANLVISKHHGHKTKVALISKLLPLADYRIFPLTSEYTESGTPGLRVSFLEGDCHTPLFRSVG